MTGRPPVSDAGSGGSAPAPRPEHLEYVPFVLYGRPIASDSLMGHVFLLIAHADPSNLWRISRGFPIQVAAWSAWRESGDGTGWEDRQPPADIDGMSTRTFRGALA